MEPAAVRHEAGLQVVDAQSGVRHHVDIPAGCRCGALPRARACERSQSLTASQPPAHPAVRSVRELREAVRCAIAARGAVPADGGGVERIELLCIDEVPRVGCHDAPHSFL